MRSLARIAALSTIFAASALAVNAMSPVRPEFELLPRRSRGKGKGAKRGKGLQAKAAKRPNMRHVSKRVRRKHRRAA